MGQVFLRWKAILLENRKFTQFLFLSLLPVLSLALEETSVVEGMTRPSRGQCDAGHVIPPAVLVSISSVPLHSVDRELGPIRFPQPCRQPGQESSGSSSCSPACWALVHLHLSFLPPGTMAGWALELCPATPTLRRGPPPASCPSVLSTMPPLSDLCQNPHLASL